MDHQTPPSPATSAATADDFLQEDYDLADSFINFNYDPDAEFESNQLAAVSDPVANSPIEEIIEQINLVDNNEELEEGEFVANDFNAVVDNAAGEVRNGGYELEEGEILASDAFAAAVTDDGDERRGVRVDSGDRSQARSENDHEVRPMVPQGNVRLRPHHQMHSVGFVNSRGESRKEVPSNGGSSSTLPGHRHCSPNYGTRKRLASAPIVDPRFPHAPGMPLPGHGQLSHFYGTGGQGLVGAVNPPFLHASVGPNFTSSGVWGNGTILPHAPAMPLHANGHQLLISGLPHQNQQHLNPAQGFPAFQLQLNPGQVFPPAAVYRGVLQPPFQPPFQFTPGSSAGRGRSSLRGRTFHRGGRKGWRPPM